MLRRAMDDALELPPSADDGGAPICPACGVTMVPAALSERDDGLGDGWVCLECEETGGPDG
jgi:hypothetical protein